jgi:hypothetical protein
MKSLALRRFWKKLRSEFRKNWEWISRDPVADDGARLVNEMKPLIAADKEKEAWRVVATFQTKVIKYLEVTPVRRASRASHAPLIQKLLEKSPRDDEPEPPICHAPGCHVCRPGCWEWPPGPSGD